MTEIPEGFVLVPIEPTREMLAAYRSFMPEKYFMDVSVWKAMIAAYRPLTPEEAMTPLTNAQMTAFVDAMPMAAPRVVWPTNSPLTTELDPVRYG